LNPAGQAALTSKEVFFKGGKHTVVVRRGRRFGFVIIALANLLATMYLSILSKSNLSQISIDLRLIAVFLSCTSSHGDSWTDRKD
jgi:hypothetical protein